MISFVCKLDGERECSRSQKKRAMDMIALKLPVSGMGITGVPVFLF